MEKKGKTGGHGKEQQEVFSKADNGSEVTKHGRLPASTLTLCHATRQTHRTTWLYITSKCFNILFYTFCKVSFFFEEESASWVLSKTFCLDPQKHNHADQMSHLQGYPEWNQTCFNEQFRTSLSSIINLTVTHRTKSSPSLEMVIVWLRNWFPVESAFSLPQRGTDSCQKCNEKWQFSQLSFACFTDRLTHNMSSSSCLSWPQRMFVHRPAGDHSLQCKFWWEVFLKYWALLLL